MNRYINGYSTVVTMEYLIPQDGEICREFVDLTGARGRLLS